MKRLIQNRKTLYMILGLIITSIFTLSIAYAVLSTTLNITGSTEISSSSWDIYLDNVRVTSRSVVAPAPEIIDNDSLSFDVDLTLPGDFYEFIVDVVNDGSIDAMIDSVIKTPELTTDQAKYIKYEITYANGESINEKQTLKKETFTPIKVRVEYRKDLSENDLPSTTTKLSLGLTLVYVQSDGSGNEVPNNGKSVKVMSGDGTQVGDEVCINEECFYTISSTESTITLFAKYNLHVGYIVDENNIITPLENPTGIQDETATGRISNTPPYVGLTIYSSDSQHGYHKSTYEGSIVKDFVDDYITYLTAQGVTPIEARLITYDELISLGCNWENNTCVDAPSWVTSTSYWVGGFATISSVYAVKSGSIFDNYLYNIGNAFGVRPIIVISKDYLK